MPERVHYVAGIGFVGLAVIGGLAVFELTHPSPAGSDRSSLRAPLSAPLPDHSFTPTPIISPTLDNLPPLVCTTISSEYSNAYKAIINDLHIVNRPPDDWTHVDVYWKDKRGNLIPFTDKKGHTSYKTRSSTAVRKVQEGQQICIDP